MFEDKEEVKKAMMELKIFGAGVEDIAGGDDNDILESSEEVACQIFPEHDELQDRFCKTLGYGKLPVTDRPSLPLTQLAVDQFTNVGLDALGTKLGRLDMTRAAEMTRTACVGPSSLVLALLYLDRLRKRNPDYLTSISSADLFLVSMMVASKFLHDDGEEDEVFNDEWAQSGGLDTKEMNNLEIDFLSAIDWRIFVGPDEFSKAADNVESTIAMKEAGTRGWATYTELTSVSRDQAITDLWKMCVDLSVKVTAVCAAAYTAGFLSLVATTAVLERTSAGPTAVSNSIRTMSKLMTNDASMTSDHDIAPPVPDTTDIDHIINTDNIEDVITHTPTITAADLLTASLLVTSLTTGMDYNNDSDHGANDDEAVTNYNRSVWLAEVSFQDDTRMLNNRVGDWQTGSYQDYDSMAAGWKTLLLEEPPIKPVITRYLGRCPVLRWSSQWVSDITNLGTIDNNQMSFIKLH